MINKRVVIFLSLFLSLTIVFALPFLFENTNELQVSANNETSIIAQKIISYSKEENQYNKIYVNGKLLGVISNLDYFNNLIKKKYQDYETDFPNTELGLSEDIYIVNEKSFVNFENIDDQIFNYLNDNDLFGIKTTKIEFSTTNGVYEIIYVKNLEDFYNARDEFLQNFISPETLNKLRNNEAITSPNELGTIETNLAVLETIRIKEATVNPEHIFTDKGSIYEFLCYGRNEEREYYTVKQGDTLQGVGYYFGNISPKQLAMLNPDILSSEQQIITPGMVLNVSYYTSPITVKVSKENLSQRYITPETPEYVEDDELEEGKYEVIVAEEPGIKNVLYKETWINGVLSTGELESESIIKQPIRGLIKIGTKPVFLRGTGNFIFPCDNPSITCHWGCYYGHTGTDFVNVYERYCDIYAMDSGVVERKGYASDMGNFCVINHNNGIKTTYMHFNVPAYVEVGQNVERGQVIGQMGTTGSSTAVHVHVKFEVNGVRENPCNYLPCSLLN